jgi:hypothetical protein
VRPHEDAVVSLTWLVYPLAPDPKDPEDGYPLAPLELVAGDQRIKLAPQLGALYPYHQAVCGDIQVAFPLGADEVAKITFAEGGEGGYLVKRTPRGLMLVEWSQSHDTCTNAKTGEMEACGKKTDVQLLAAPANARVVHRLMRVDAAGKQTPFNCKVD